MSFLTLRHEKTEHRLTKFLLVEGFGVRPGDSTWKKVLWGNDRLSFEGFSLAFPDFPIDLEFQPLSKGELPTLTSALSYPEKLRLIKEFPPALGTKPIGRVLSYEGIKGGLIIHDADLPLDFESGSVFWCREGQQIRMQRFAEFCLAMRGINWQLDGIDAGLCDDRPPLEYMLALHVNSGLALKICLLLLGFERNAPSAGDSILWWNGFQFVRCEGERYLIMPHQAVARLLSCDKSSVKRCFAELEEKGVVASVRDGRFKAYRLIFLPNVYKETKETQP